MTKKMIYIVYYQGKQSKFVTFSDAYMFTLLLKHDNISYSFILTSKESSLI